MKQRVKLCLLMAGVAVAFIPNLLACRQPHIMGEGPIARNVFRLGFERTIVPDRAQDSSFFTFLATPPIVFNGVRLTYVGTVAAPRGIEVLHRANPLQVIWPARLVSLAALLLTGCCLGRFVARRMGTLAGFAAATAILLSPGLVRLSAAALPDTTAMLFSTLALLSGIKMFESDGRERVKWIFWGSFVAGLAAATRHHAVVSIVPVVVAAASSGRRAHGAETLRLFSLAAAGAVTGFLLGCPGWLFAPSRFWSSLWFEGDHSAVGPGGFGIPILGQLELLARHVPLLFVGSVCGTYAWWRKPDLAARLAIAMSAAMLLLAFAFRKQAFHDLLPMLPPMALLLGYAVSLLANVNANRVALGLACGAVLLLSVKTTASLPYLKPSTTELAHQWLRDNVGQNETVALDRANVPRLNTNRRMAEWSQLRKSPLGRTAADVIAKAQADRVFRLVAIKYDEEWAAETTATYVVTSSVCFKPFVSTGFFTARPPSRNSLLRDDYLLRQAFYLALWDQKKWQLVFRSDNGHGPATLVFTRRQ